MFSMCKICKGVGIIYISGALVCHCPTDFDKEYVHVPHQPHTHHENYVHRNYSHNIIVTASSVDPSGEIHYLSDVTASRDTTTGDGWGVINSPLL